MALRKRMYRVVWHWRESPMDRQYTTIQATQVPYAVNELIRNLSDEYGHGVRRKVVVIEAVLLHGSSTAKNQVSGDE